MSKKEVEKRCIALLLALIMVLSLVGCGAQESVQPDVVSTDDTEISATPSQDASVLGEDLPNPQNQSDDESTTESQDALEEPSFEPIPEEAPSSETPAVDAEPSINETPVPTSSPIPTDTPSPAETPTIQEDTTQEDTAPSLTSTQRNAINMLNYMSALTQRVNEERRNQLFLESAYNSFDNLYPNAIDKDTQAQINDLMDRIQEYRMISVKRDRLVYIYEQNRAQAMRQAIPNPLGLLSAVQSGSLLKAAVSVLYMAMDSATSYNAATSQADMQFIKEGWELDDAESAALHESTKAFLNFVFDMVRKYDLPGDYALNREAIEQFVTWSTKPDSELVRKISWFESQENVYKEFGPYWLELAKDYYNAEEYAKCLDAVAQYESVTTRIFRKDIDFATVLPMAITSAKILSGNKTLSEAEYIKIANQYCTAILENTKVSDWSIRYFVAQVYVDLFALTENSTYIDDAYKIAYENVVVLVDSQRELNAAYLAVIEEVKPGKDATKREKEEIKKYNKLIKEERKTALPPVNEALYLNCELLFALAEKRNISEAEKRKIDSILHVNGENIFLTEALDSRFWFEKKVTPIKAADIEVSFDGETLTLPVICISDRSRIIATITGPNGTTTIEDWTVKEVKRPKNASCSEFIVILVSEAGKSYKYQAGEAISIRVIPVVETPEEYIEFSYNVTAVKKALVFDGISFERIK